MSVSGAMTQTSVDQIEKESAIAKSMMKRVCFLIAAGSRPKELADSLPMNRLAFESATKLLHFGSEKIIRFVASIRGW